MASNKHNGGNLAKLPPSDALAQGSASVASAVATDSEASVAVTAAPAGAVLAGVIDFTVIVGPLVPTVASESGVAAALSIPQTPVVPYLDDRMEEDTTDYEEEESTSPAALTGIAIMGEKDDNLAMDFQDGMSVLSRKWTALRGRVRIPCAW